MASRLRFLPAIIFLCSSIGSAASFQYMRIGSQTDVTTKTSFGIAMMGGGSDLDEAFGWLCNKGGGGDFLILRARGDDDYNSYVNGLCKANSVATLVIPDRASAEEPKVAETIRRAEVVFIAGGDQISIRKLLEGNACPGCDQSKHRRSQADWRNQRGTGHPRTVWIWMLKGQAG